MKTIIASTRENAGKTSIIVGMAKNLQKPLGYVKPFGDRLLCLRKRLWDYDAPLMVEVFGRHADPENTTLGFDPSRLRSTYEPEEGNHFAAGALGHLHNRHAGQQSAAATHQ